MKLDHYRLADGWLPWEEDATGTLRPPKDCVDLKAGEAREDRYDYDGERRVKPIPS